MRVIVVGRGVFGLTAAAGLAAAGHRVIVVGPRDLGAASEAASRLVRNDYSDEFHRSWAGDAIDGWHRWNDESDEDLFHPVGLANLAGAPWDDEPFVRGASAGLSGARRIGSAEIARLLPFLASGRFTEGSLNPRAGWVAASAAVRWLERRCEEAGVGIIPERVATVGDGWVGLVGDGLLRADRIVVAAGAWTPGLVPETRPLLVPSGQPVLFFRPADPGPFADVPVYALGLATTGFYGFPVSPAGLVKIGHHGRGIIDDVDPGPVPDLTIDRFRRFLRTTIPALAGAPVVDSRICFYCDAPGGRFLVSEVPGRPGLVVAGGGSGHGFKFAPVLGPVITAVVTGMDHPRRTAVGWRLGGRGADEARAGDIGAGC